MRPQPNGILFPTNLAPGWVGIVYQSKGDGANARDHFDRFRRVSQWRTEDTPDNAGYFFDLALAQTRLGQSRGGRVAGERAAGIEPTAYIKLARLYSVQGRTDEAFDLLSRAAGAGFRADLNAVRKATTV